jgi:hypothetical protein
MRSRTPAVSLAIVGLAFAGCGSTKKAATTPATSATLPPGATGIAHPPPVKSVTYRVKLAGANEVPAGAPTGSGVAVISIKASSGEVCWTFSQLKNVTAPKEAHIHRGLAGTSGNVVIALGGAYKASGCVPGTPRPLLGLIGANPQRFYVNIHNAKYPGGAVRGQL